MTLRAVDYFGSYVKAADPSDKDLGQIRGYLESAYVKQMVFKRDKLMAGSRK